MRIEVPEDGGEKIGLNTSRLGGKNHSIWDFLHGEAALQPFSSVKELLPSFLIAARFSD